MGVLDSILENFLSFITGKTAGEIGGLFNNLASLLYSALLLTYELLLAAYNITVNIVFVQIFGLFIIFIQHAEILFIFIEISIVLMCLFFGVDERTGKKNPISMAAMFFTLNFAFMQGTFKLFKYAIEVVHDIVNAIISI
jgi:hypothetical protein